MPTKKIMVTGGAGFIGTNFIRHILNIRPEWQVVNLDCLTYAGNPGNFDDLPADQAARYRFVRGDITDTAFLDSFFSNEVFDGIFHFAAESHVDRSIMMPGAFIKTNVMGTFNLLHTVLGIYKQKKLPADFRFLHVSTDEVYGSLGPTGYFTEETPYDPSSPYSASKAGSDHLVKAYFRTYGLPTLVTNCSNNYGPYQFPEKLIPLIILNILEKKALPVYGDGKNIRDWLYVIDHCDAILTVYEKGKCGETYNVGGNSEYENIAIVHLLCDIIDKRVARSGKDSSRNLIQFVPDRPGHDRRYAIDASKIKKELGWQPAYRLENAIEQTVDWYMGHMDWVNSVRSGDYLNWIKDNYENRKV